MKRIWITLPIIVCLAGLAVVGLRSSSIDGLRVGKEDAGSPHSALAGKRLLFVNSYHEGYPWSDGIEQGLREVLSGTGVEVRTVAMDTKRRANAVHAANVTRELLALIERWQPHVMIAADDNASRYVIAPHFRDAELPVVFCGVNWDASMYGYPFTNTTGMVEISLVSDLIRTMEAWSAGSRIGFLGADNLSNRKEEMNYRAKLGIELQEVVFVSGLDEWKQSFLDLQSKVDMLLIAPPSFVSTSEEQADLVEFVRRETQVPTGCVEDWIAPYCLFGYTKVAEEQGEWAAETALRILGGASPAQIDVVTNERGVLHLNLPIAARLGIEFPASLLDEAVVIDG